MLYKDICWMEVQKLSNRSKIIGYSKIPDELPSKLNDCRDIPNYKKMAIMILNNNFGKRKKSKYYSILKRIEIDARKKTGWIQLNLFD